MPSNTPVPTLNLPIIGYVRSPLTQKFGIPRQPNLVNVPCELVFIPPFDNPQAFEGLEEFSHIWVIWQFHHNRMVDNQRQHFRAQVRPPRLGGNEKIGVFATRSMYRPSPIGLSVVQLLAIKTQDNAVRLAIAGADMVDGTPVLDIKPYIGYSDSIMTAQSSYATVVPSKKVVLLTERAKQQQQALIEGHYLEAADISLIEQLIGQDPRPAYRQAEVASIFIMRYKQVDVSFYMDNAMALWIDSLLLV